MVLSMPNYWFKRILLVNLIHRNCKSKQQTMITDKQIQQSDLLEDIYLNKVSVKKDWNLIKNRFNVLYPSFYIDFLKKGIRLSATEERYLLLEKIGMTATYIASALGILPESVHKLKYRLNKKINSFQVLK
jgi:DNA-binding CsgD family transcriptional regulator